MTTLRNKDMRKRFQGCALLWVLGAFFVAPPALAAADVTVPVSRAELIEVPVEMGEVIVADPRIADVYVHGKNKVSIIGKTLGITTVRVFDPEGKLIRSVEVTVGYDLPAIRKALKEFLPYEPIGVEMVNTNLALTGQVSSISAADKAVKIVNEYVEPAFSVSSTKPTMTSAAKNDGELATGYQPTGLRPKVINLMTVTAGQQVMLRVRVGEMRRTALKNLGVNLQMINSGTNGAIALATGSGTAAVSMAGGLGPNFGIYSFPTQGNTVPRGLIGGTYLNNHGNGVSGVLDALERDGLFKVLAEPNLVAMSGEKAQFLAGGEFPIPVQADDGQISIKFKPFGVSVNFLPVVLNESRVRVQVEPEVSEISNEGAIVINSIEIPAISTRRAKTTVELAPGESFMIGGLILDEMKSTIEQLPGVSEIPVLSALFRSTAYQREETELVLAITPYLVDPMLSGDVKLPTDEFKPASVMESFFYGALGSLSDDAERISQTPSLEGPIGFMVD